MSYAMAAPLQAAIYQRLTGDPALAALVGTAIYDVVPDGPVPDLYVTLGEEDVRDRSDQTGAGALHDFTVRVVTAEAGFQRAKAAAGAISDALVEAPPPAMGRGRIVGLWFLRARARRIDGGDQRRIELRFRAHLEDDAINQE